MTSKWVRFLTLGLLAASLAFAGCGSGSDGRDGVDGADGTDGMDGPPGPTVINASQVSDDFLDGVEVMSEITNVEIASPPVVTFTLTSSTGVPITGIVPFWEADHRYVRFTITKLVPGTSGDPDSWVAYVQDDGAPDYDTGSSLVDNGDGSYTFTFVTDVAAVPGVPYEPTLTHRVAGQIGSSSVPLQPQNLVYDYVPAGGPVALERNIAVMASCNECHDDLVFHGRRFKVEYCVQCHNPDLADGEGNMSFMTHRIHAAGSFDVLDDAISYEEVTYPQDLANCRKCHNGDDAETPQGNNWREVPNLAACTGCHDDIWFGAPGSTPPDFDNHTGGAQADNSACAMCHDEAKISRYHTTTNATPNNPDLETGQRSITYELIDASVDGGNVVTVNLKILSDGTPLDVANLPQDLLDGARYPGLLLAYALPQGDIDEPQDYNNFGRKSAQPISLGLDGFIDMGTTGTHSYNAGTGVNTFMVTDPGSQFPVGATLRAVGLQGYLRQDLDDDGSYDVSLHTPSAVVAVTGDDERRTVVDSAKCANCHEWFEGHGGNRVYDMQICTLCHVPNLSSSGRQLDLEHPEDSQNLKDMVHGIHASDVRTRDFEHVRNRSGGSYYNWSEVTFPRGASVGNCSLCHDGDTFDLPLGVDLLATTVRTTGVPDGMDPTIGDADTAFETLPNDTDWVNTPTASSCFYCHTSEDAAAHMIQNGALLSIPDGSWFTHRSALGSTYETCAVCHGGGRSAAVGEVHGQ